jgi:hypothetical protein
MRADTRCEMMDASRRRWAMQKGTDAIQRCRRKEG